MSVSVALLSRAPFAGTAFFYLRICLSVHAFTDLHLGNTARSFHASLPLFYCTLLYFNSRCSFIFIRVKLNLCIFLCSTYPRSSSIKSFLNSLNFSSYCYIHRSRASCIFINFLHFREASLTFSLLPVYLK